VFSTLLIVASSSTVATPAAMPVNDDKAIHGRKGFSRRLISAASPFEDVMRKSFRPWGDNDPAAWTSSDRTGNEWKTTGRMARVAGSSEPLPIQRATLRNVHAASA